MENTPTENMPVEMMPNEMRAHNVVQMPAPQNQAPAASAKPAMENFMSLGLPQPLTNALTRMKFTTPTPIQAQAIPIALQGRDILGSAQTGTGKTAAFAIPMIAHLIKNPEATTLIMTPTRELASQVMAAVIQMVDRSTGIRTALLIGGESMQKQFRQLNDRPRVVIGTPGRINDHLNRRSLKLDKASFLVLDETDRMLDMGFGIQIDAVLKFMPAQRQTLMFSATMPAHIVKMSDKYMNKPERIAVGSVSNPVDRIKQDLVHTSTANKYTALLAELATREGSIIVFVKTKFGADRLAQRLSKENHSADAIHGDLKQNKRDRVIKAFRDKQHRIMVATDVAARGLDIPHIEHVINFDLPQSPEDYIHRIGRTARAGAEGSAVALLTPEDGEKWRAIQRLMNPGVKIEGPAGHGAPRKKPRRYGGSNNNRPFGNGQRDKRRA